MGTSGDVVEVNAAELVTVAGFPNPHVRPVAPPSDCFAPRRRPLAASPPTPAGAPAALGPSAAVGVEACGRAPQEVPLADPRLLSEQVLRQKAKIAELEARAATAKAAGDAVAKGDNAAEAPHGGRRRVPNVGLADPQRLSEQVLRQKAKIAELEAQAAAARVAAETAGRNKGAEDTEDGEEGEEEEEYDEENLEQRLARLMEAVKPCAEACPVAMAQSTERQRIETLSGKWTVLKGTRLLVRTASDDECVLLLANAAQTPESEGASSSWTLQRGGSVVSPRIGTHGRRRGLSHGVFMPYLDQPGKRMECEYQIAATASGASAAPFMVSDERQRRQIAAVSLPAGQCAWVEDDDRFVIEPGPWRDVDAFYEVVTTLPGERVLVVCVMHYCAKWASELNRGRFTIVRDDVGLDGLHDRGLQSVRALNPELPATLVMMTVDEPPAGPHLYRVRAAMTAGDVSGVTTSVQGHRQLALIRLPGSAVVGPCHTSGPVTIDESRWTEIPGFEVTVTLKRPRDKVMIVFHADCSPQSYHYEAHFTILRRGVTGSIHNLGFSEDFGLQAVTSDYAASSEYPAGAFVDAPGSIGPHTYNVAARVANMGTSSDPPPVIVGHSGSISAIVLASR